MRVRVRVAVHVAQLDELAQAIGAAHLHDLAVLHRDHRRAGRGEDVDPLAGARRGDGERRVLALLDPLVGHGRVVDVVGVAGLGVHGEVPLREARERPDEVGGQPADQTRAHEHRVDVPVGVVVGEDGAADVLVGARGLQVARGGEDRVDRVEGILAAVVVGVDAVALPRGGHELHPAHGAGGRDVEVAPVVGLDLVDRGQDLPAHAVLDARGLVDRQQERRDPELVDEEVGHADRRGPGERLGERRVAERRLPVGLTQAGILERLVGGVLGLLRRVVLGLLDSIDRSLSLGDLARGLLCGLQAGLRLLGRGVGRAGRLAGCSRRTRSPSAPPCSGRRWGRPAPTTGGCTGVGAGSGAGAGAGGRDVLDADDRRADAGDLDLVGRRTGRHVDRHRDLRTAEERDQQRALLGRRRHRRRAEPGKKQACRRQTDEKLALVHA